MPQETEERDPPQPQPRPPVREPAYEIVYQFDAAVAAKAYKRFLWRRSRRLILILCAISLGCLVAIFSWEPNIFLILGTAYTASFVAMWFSQMANVDEAYEALEGRKVRLLIDNSGLSSYFGNTFKRVQWLGVSRIRQVGDFYFIHYERDSVPSGGFPKKVISDEALELVRATGKLIEER